MHTLKDFKIAFITSADGTRIGYRKTGKGPGLILVHGALQSSLDFTELARSLSADFTVYIPDRRGRGLSGAYGDKDDLVTEAGDILALARHTNTSDVFGLSSGAIILLQAALTAPVFKKIALYEPPVQVRNNPFKKLDTDYKHAMGKENLGRAFIAILKGTGDASLLSILPGFITAPAVNRMIKAQMKNRPERVLPLQELVPLFRHDRNIIRESESIKEHVKSIQAKVLLLGGSRSKKFLRHTLDWLSASLPDAQRTEFKKLGHIAAANGESPLKVADALLRFFKEK